jgi:hypothetical protein
MRLLVGGLLLIAAARLTVAFPSLMAATTTAPAPQQHSSTRRRRIALQALTERQLQFWEDVEEGLDDIEGFWSKQGQSLERIRRFAKR